MLYKTNNALEFIQEAVDFKIKIDEPVVSEKVDVRLLLSILEDIVRSIEQIEK